MRSGITEKLRIKIGADLQKDEHQREKAYTLLGMLVTQLSVPTEIEKMEKAERLGKQFLFDKRNDEREQNRKTVTEDDVAG